MSGVKGLDNLRHSLSAGILFKNFPDDRSTLRINMKPSFFIHTVAKSRIAAVAQALLSIDVHTPANLLGKLCGVVFCHTFQNTFHQDAAGIIADVFPCGDHSHTVLFQFCLVDGTVISVAGKTVKLVNQNTLKGMLITVGNHPLELGAAVGGSALSAVNILSDNEIAIVFSILIAGMELSLNGLLSLAMTGVASIDDNIHCFASPNIRSSASLSRAFIGDVGSKHISTNFCIWESFC